MFYCYYQFVVADSQNPKVDQILDVRRENLNVVVAKNRKEENTEDDVMVKHTFYSKYHDLDKLNLVKICNGILVLGLSQYPLLPQLPQKMTLASKYRQK